MPRRCGETRLVADSFGQWPDGPITTGGTGFFRGGTVMPDPIKQFRDQNGRPYANGQLWTYRAGTLVALATYRDIDLTTPYDNPVTLDLDGRATIYLAQAIYKFVLQTANGVTVWEQDHVPGSIWAGATMAFGRPVAPPGSTSMAHRLVTQTTKAQTGTHSWVIGMRVDPILICPGTARVTVAASMYIPGAPTDGATNYALHVSGSTTNDRARFSDLQFGSGQVTLGGGATALLGQIGDPNGPDKATQGGWQRFLRTDGKQIFVPYWTTSGPPLQPTIFSYVEVGGGQVSGDINLNASPINGAFLTLLSGTLTITVSAQATVSVYAVAGGGGGGGDTTGSFNGSSGGGGGATTQGTTIVLLPNVSYTATIGTLGAGMFSVGDAGGLTRFTNGITDSISLGGGGGGGDATAGSVGGAGGVATSGSNLVDGGKGGDHGTSGSSGNPGLCNSSGAGGGGGGSAAGPPGTQRGGTGGGSIGSTLPGGAGGTIGQPGNPGTGSLNPAQGGGATTGFATGGGGGGGAGAHLPAGVDFGGGGGGAGGSGGNGGVPGGNGSPGLMVFTLVSLP